MSLTASASIDKKPTQPRGTSAQPAVLKTSESQNFKQLSLCRVATVPSARMSPCQRVHLQVLSGHGHDCEPVGPGVCGNPNLTAFSQVTHLPTCPSSNQRLPWTRPLPALPALPKTAKDAATALGASGCSAHPPPPDRTRRPAKGRRNRSETTCQSKS